MVELQLSNEQTQKVFQHKSNSITQSLISLTD